MFRHPKYYKELRKRNKSDQVISSRVDVATSSAQRASGPGLQVTSYKLSSFKRQASSPKQQASSLKPQATSSWTFAPSKSFTVPEPRCSMQMKVLCGCFTWKAIWCGLKRTLLLLVTFNSIVKKWPLALLTSKSGVPCKL